MGEKKNSKPKETSEEKYRKEVKGELNELKEKREKLGGGFRNILRKAAINKQISDKAKVLGVRDRIKRQEQELKYKKALLANKKVEFELNEMSKKNAVRFEDLY